jgi:DNA-binding NarL/FixJ family response regulator
MPNTIKILLAEDQQLVRSSLQQLLQSNTNYEVIASVSNGEETLHFLENSDILPDLCVLDIQMPKMDGIECTKIVKQLFPAIKILLLTSYDHDTYMEQSFMVNVDGYLLKEANLDSFYRAVDTVLDGQFVAPIRMMNKIAARLTSLREIERKSKYNNLTKLLSVHSDSLDNKDLEIIKLIWQGWTNRMIAEDLYISEGTVKNYVSRMYRKLKINTRSELLQLLVENDRVM